MKKQGGGFKWVRTLILLVLVLYLVGAIAQMKFNPMDAFSFWLQLF